jgi:hypothetical protein
MPHSQYKIRALASAQEKHMAVIMSFFQVPPFTQHSLKTSPILENNKAFVLGWRRERHSKQVKRFIYCTPNTKSINDCAGGRTGTTCGLL